MFFFFNDTATTEIYTLSLHDALPICGQHLVGFRRGQDEDRVRRRLLQRLQKRVPGRGRQHVGLIRSEEHTSELQSRQYLVCRLLLEKKKHVSTFTTNKLVNPLIKRLI